MGDLIDLNGILIIVSVIVAISIVLLALKFYVDKRYVPIRFLEWHKGFFRHTSYRLDGTTIIEGDMFTLLFGRGRLGEDISAFEKTLEIGNTLPWQNGPCYVAADAFGTLIPLHIKLDAEEYVVVRDPKTGEDTEQPIPMIQPMEVQTGKRIANRYIEAKRFTATQAKSTDALIAGLLAALPNAILIFATLLGLYLLMSPIVKSIMDMSVVLDHAATEIHSITETLKVVYGEGAFKDLPPLPANATIKGAG